MDAFGLVAAIPGEVQRVADDDARATVAAGEAEDRALITAGLRTLDSQEGPGDAESVGERDTDAAGAYVEAEPRLRLTEEWHCRHAMMIASEAEGGDYNRM